MLKPLSNLRTFKLDSNSLSIKLHTFFKRKVDYDVFLPKYNCNLQRELVWSLKQKQRLIESMLIRRDIPNISIIQIEDPTSDTHEDLIQVIDGKQRLSAMRDFYLNDFSITLEGNNYYFKDLPKEYQIAISRYDIRFDNVYEGFGIKNRITDDDKIEWYERLNFFGTEQDENHIKNIKGELKRGL